MDHDYSRPGSMAEVATLEVPQFHQSEFAYADIGDGLTRGVFSRHNLIQNPQARSISKVNIISSWLR
jgi:hypothetical protein